MDKCIIIPDSFKGTMTSPEVCSIMSAAVKRRFPGCQVITIPIADGGEGTVDCFLKANPFINKEDIDDVVLIKREEWATHNVFPYRPQDVVLVTTKKDSAIKTFFLNGRPKNKHRGIELGCLLDNAVLKRQIKKQWGINPKRITDITVEGKDIHIYTK